MRKGGDFSFLTHCVIWRKKKVFLRIYVNDTSVQTHTSKDGNRTGQVTTAQLMNFANGRPRKINDQNEFGRKKENLLEEQLSELSKIMGEKRTFGKVLVQLR